MVVDWECTNSWQMAVAFSESWRPLLSMNKGLFRVLNTPLME